jgi:hypothetical protein
MKNLETPPRNKPVVEAHLRLFLSWEGLLEHPQTPLRCSVGHHMGDGNVGFKG